MIRIFSGEDTFESYALAKIQADKFAKDLGQEIKILNADQITDPTEFIQYLEGVGMFSESFVVFLKRLSNNKKLLEFFTQNYPSLKAYNIVIWEDRKVDSRLKFYQLSKKENILFSYEAPKEAVLKTWITNLVKEKNIKLTSDQISMLIQNIGFDKWKLTNEIEKISIYCDSKKMNQLDDVDFDNIVGYDIEGDIWKLVDAFSNRDRKACIRELDKIMKVEDNSQYVIAMLIRELSLLSQVIYCNQNNIDTSALKVHPFVLQKIRAKARKFSLNDVKFFIKKLFDLDFAIKKGNIEQKIGLTLYILSI